MVRSTVSCRCLAAVASVVVLVNSNTADAFQFGSSVFTARSSSSTLNSRHGVVDDASNSGHKSSCSTSSLSAKATPTMAFEMPDFGKMFSDALGSAAGGMSSVGGGAGGGEVRDCVIIGSGISGSTLGYYLNSKGVDCVIMEARDDVGGNVISKKEDGFLWEEGPNTFQPTPYIMRATVDLNLKDELVLADASLPRLVYWEDNLYPLPSSPKDILFNFNLLSWPGKIRAGLGAIGLVLPPPQNEEESVKDFVTRHLGSEAFEKLIDPFVSGVYAGDPAKLAMKSALKKVGRLEDLGGPGLIDGAILRLKERAQQEKDLPAPLQAEELPKYVGGQLGSFKDGLQALPRAVKKAMPEGKVRTSWVLESIAKTTSADGEDEFITTFKTPKGTTTVRSKVVVSTAPAHRLTSLNGLTEIIPEAARLKDVYYPPVASVTLAYPKSAFKEPLKGFGHLIPRKMKTRTLGTIWSSSLFPERVPEGYEMLLSYIGGAQDPAIKDLSTDEIVKEVDNDVRKILLNEDAPAPKVLGCRVWPTAIPQYNKGHNAILADLAKGMEKVPGLKLAGNYVTGVAFGDCVQYGYEEAERIAEYLSSSKSKDKNKKVGGIGGSAKKEEAAAPAEEKELVAAN